MTAGALALPGCLRTSSPLPGCCLAHRFHCLPHTPPPPPPAFPLCSPSKGKVSQEPRCPSLCLCLSLSVSFCVSLSVYISASVSLSLYHAVSVYIYLCLTISLSLHATRTSGCPFLPPASLACGTVLDDSDPCSLPWSSLSLLRAVLGERMGTCGFSHLLSCQCLLPCRPLEVPGW